MCTKISKSTIGQLNCLMLNLNRTLRSPNSKASKNSLRVYSLKFSILFELANIEMNIDKKYTFLLLNLKISLRVLKKKLTYNLKFIIMINWQKCPTKSIIFTIEEIKFLLFILCQIRTTFNVVIFRWFFQIFRDIFYYKIKKYKTAIRTWVGLKLCLTAVVSNAIN